MSHHFFLSYARADSSPLVKRFFEDLCDTIRIASGLPRHEVVGFYHEPEYQPRFEWSAGSAEALQSSRSMVCLLSPAYFRSERAGKEWQGFEMRRRRSLERGDLPEGRVQIIMPVSWTTLEGPVPKVISDLLAHPDRIHHKHPVRTMFQSSGKLLSDYADFVNTLADQIMEVAEMATPPKLDSLPPMNEVHSAFHIWGDPVTTLATLIEDRSPSDNHKRFMDDEFVKTLEKHGAAARARTQSLTDVSDTSGHSTAHVPEGIQAGLTSQTRMDSYTISVIDDEEQIRRLIEECCNLEGLFDVKTYQDSNTALRDLDLSMRQGEVPDAFVIDLGKGLQGLQLIQQLRKERNVSSAILALSANVDDDGLLQASNLGADAFLQKPFSTDMLMENVEHCAQIGRRCRLRRRGERQPDASRKQRPVFLSYCTKDDEPADFLTKSLEAKGIGVWYAPDTLQPGDEWREGIRNGLLEAQVFLPLITDNYATSQICLAEMGKFFRRLKTESHQRPLVIPMLYNSPDAALQIEYIRRCLRYQYVTMSPENHVDGLTALLGRIQNTLGIHKAG